MLHLPDVSQGSVAPLPPPPPQTLRLGTRLHARRLDLGLNQREAAEVIQCTQQQLSKWEDRKGKPAYTHADGIAAYLDVGLDVALLLIHAEHTGRSVDELGWGTTHRLQAVEEALDGLVERAQVIEGLSQRVDMVVDAFERLGITKA